MRENHLQFTQTEHRAIPSIKALLYKIHSLQHLCASVCVGKASWRFLFYIHSSWRSWCCQCLWNLPKYEQFIEQPPFRVIYAEECPMASRVHQDSRHSICLEHQLWGFSTLLLLPQVKYILTRMSGPCVWPLLPRFCSMRWAGVIMRVGGPSITITITMMMIIITAVIVYGGQRW